MNIIIFSKKVPGSVFFLLQKSQKNEKNFQKTQLNTQINKI